MLLPAIALTASALAGLPPLDYTIERDLPRHATPAEAVWEAVLPRIADRGPGGAPTGPVTCPGEYAPSDGILLSYHPSYSAGVLSIVRQMAVHITTTGQARAYIVFSSPTARDSTLPMLQSQGADLSRIVPVVTSLNSIWIRDFGPRYIYEGDGPSGPVRAIINHTYNRTTRTIDNNFPNVFSASRRHALYTIPLIHGGGNYHLDSLGRAYATRLIVNENPSLNAAQIVSLWSQYQNVDTTLTEPFPTSVDLTQHIDMWMQVMDDDKVMISRWPSNPGTIQDTICNNTAASLEAAGYQVTRVPARTIGGVHYTYTNVVMCNDLVLIPAYVTASVAPHNAEALAAFQTALPGKTIVPINCDSIVGLAGVMHCICMHVPAHRGQPDAAIGGLAPTTYVRSPRGGPTVSYSPGQAIDIRWITDDDLGVTNVDLHLSFDSGSTWPVTIAAPTTDDGQHTWFVPDYSSRQARIRVTARDADGRTGYDLSSADFTLAGSCPADFNNSLSLSVQDLYDFLAAFFASQPRADFNGVGGVSVQDLFDFIGAYLDGCG